jgi:serpin B
VLANNRLAVSLLEHVRKTHEDNLFFSPSNILQTLAMAFVGARGETERQMSKILGEDLSREETLEAIQALNQELLSDGSGEGHELSVAYAAWLKPGVGVLGDYSSLLRERLQAGFSELDFAGDPAAAAETINAWVDEETNGMIKEVIGPLDIDHLTLAILTGAIYFLGKWENEFDPSSTAPADFLRPGTPAISVATMWQTRRFRYADTESCRAVELPYRGGKLAMVVVLPQEEAVVAPSAGALGPGGQKAIRSLLDSLDFPSCDVTVGLPRFEMDTTMDLSKALSQMGMTDAFDPEKADFSGMIDHDEFALSAVLHKARVKVDEQGTEAAAVTMMALAAGVIEEEEIIFHVNRPFLFLIVERRTGAVVFMGSVVEPEAMQANEEAWPADAELTEME